MLAEHDRVRYEFWILGNKDEHKSFRYIRCGIVKGSCNRNFDVNQNI